MGKSTDDFAVTTLVELKELVEGFTGELLQPYQDRVKNGQIPRSSKEVNDALWGTVRLTPLEVGLLDSPLLQRLRFIRQLGVVHWIYPGAGHTRFEHTLGVLHQTQQLVSAINLGMEEADLPITKEKASLLRLCALMHDIGHGVFSHVSEHALDLMPSVRRARVAFGKETGCTEPKLSELMAYYMVESEAFRSLLSALVGELGSPLPSQPGTSDTVEVIVKTVKNAIVGHPIDDQIPLLHELITGPFDADKLDYFVRDAMMAGIPVALDISRLTHKLAVKPVDKRKLPSWIAGKVAGNYNEYYLFGLKWSGAAMLDELHLARILLYSKIYRHPKVQAVEAMVERVFLSLSQVTKVRNLIALIYNFSDDQLLRMTAAEMASQLEVTSTEANEVRLALAAETLKSAMARDLFVKAFVFQIPFPGDPWAEDDSQQSGLRKIQDELCHPERVEQLRENIVSEVIQMQHLLHGDDPARSNEWIDHNIAISAKSKLSGGTQIDRALIFQGDQVSHYSEGRVDRSAWADAYGFSFPAGFIFAPKEISPLCFVAAQKVLRQRYDVTVPESLIELSKQDQVELGELQARLEESGYYRGVSYDIRPTPSRFEKADFNEFINEVVEKLSLLEEPVVEGHETVRRPKDFGDRIRAWLVQFRTDDDVECAMALLRAIKVLRRNDTAQTLKSFVAAHPEFKGAHICMLGELKDSTAVQSYFAGDASGDFAGVTTIQDAARGKFETPIVFLDDFICSGGQVVDILGNWFKADDLKKDLGEQRQLFDAGERDYLLERDVAFVYVAGWQDGQSALEKACQKLKLEAKVYIHTPENELPFAFENCLSEFDQNRKEAFMQKCRDIGMSLLSSNENSNPQKQQERALGYGNRAMLVLSPYNIPTQCLTCLWHEGEHDGVPWMPLLHRRTKK